MNPTRTAGHAISRMPRHLREQVSHCLEDGGDWRAVTALCKAAGYPGVRAQNVTNFRKGAHREWLEKQTRIEALRRDSAATAEAVRFYAEHGGSPAEAGLLAAAEMISTAISSIGPECMAQLAADDPKAILSMMRELARVADTLRKTEAKTPSTAPAGAKEAMTPEERTRALKEIFGLPA